MISADHEAIIRLGGDVYVICCFCGREARVDAIVSAGEMIADEGRRYRIRADLHQVCLDVHPGISGSSCSRRWQLAETAQVARVAT